MCYVWLYVASSLSRYIVDLSFSTVQRYMCMSIKMCVTRACSKRVNCFLVPLNVKTQVMEMIACLIWLVFGVHYRKLLPLCSYGWAGKEIFSLSFV